MGTFTLGCAVWTCRDWLGNLYPAKTQSRDFLRLFGQRFNAVEGNTTFYAVPPVSTLEKWKRETPEAFRFCLKIPRDFSHQGDVWPHAEAIVSFHDHAEAILGDRLGPFFLQLPESYGPAQGPDLSRVLNQWRRRCSTDINVELRHPSWFAEGELRQRLLTMLTRLNTGQVILDTRPVYEGPGMPCPCLRTRNRASPC